MIRPDEITVTAHGSDGRSYAKKLNADNQWSVMFSNLPKYANGKTIDYTLTEEAVPGYTSSITRNGKSFTLINTHVDETKNITFTVASNRSYQKNGNWENSASYISCAATGKVAEFIAAHFHKGDPIMLTGMLTSSTYQNKDGQNRNSYTVWVEKATFASRKNAQNDAATAPAANAAPTAQAPAAQTPPDPNYGGFPASDFQAIDDEDDLPF